MILYVFRYFLFFLCFFFFFNDTATTEIYTLSLHDALPIWRRCPWMSSSWRSTTRRARWFGPATDRRASPPDRKSTRLNSSHLVISYAVFCLKKKKNTYTKSIFKKKKKKR